MTDSFKKLQAQWYQKLADDGFEDIEGTSDIVNPQIFSKAGRYAVRNERELTDFLKAGKFKRPRDGHILKLYLTGISYSEIGEQLGLTKYVVYRTMKRIRHAINV